MEMKDKIVVRGELALVLAVLIALILAGLYLIVDSTVLPTITQRIKDMFDYAG